MSETATPGWLALNTSSYDDGEDPPYDMTKADRLAKLTPSLRATLPASYSTNSTKELLVLEFVGKFRRQYSQHFPHRPMLPLTPMNELGVPKFLPTFVRPGLLSVGGLATYDPAKLARFLSRFIRYQPLVQPDQPPSHVTSISTTLAWQAGDCLDATVLLVSLLRGAGVQAYGVLGYASRHITTMDLSVVDAPADDITSCLPTENEQRMTVTPSKHEDLSPPALAALYPQLCPAVPASGQVEENHYVMKQRPLLKPTFDRRLFDRAGEPSAKAADDDAADLDSGLRDLDHSGSRRFHAWVVCVPWSTPNSGGVSGRRTFTAPTFIEPSSGLCIDLHSQEACHYSGVEAIFDHTNLWALVAPNPNPSSGSMWDPSVLPAASLNYDVGKLTDWEPVLLPSPDPSRIPHPDKEHNPAWGTVDGLPEAIRDAAVLGQTGDAILSLPPAWSLPAALTQRRFESEYPGLSLRRVYRDYTIDNYAAMWEPDRKVCSILRHSDRSMYTIYRSRADKLRIKAVEPSSGCTREWFLPGRKREDVAENLAAIIHVDGVRRELWFYAQARTDGLLCRIEHFFDASQGRGTEPRKTEDFFVGREDFLRYRGATYSESPEVPAATVTAAMSDNSIARSDISRNPRRIELRFGRNEAVDASCDVFQKIFRRPGTAEAEIEVKYHPAEGAMIHPVRRFARHKPVIVDRANPFQRYPKRAELAAAMFVLFDEETNLINDMKDAERDVRETLHQREKQDENPTLELGVFAILEDEPTSTTSKSEQEDESKPVADYLSIYLQACGFDGTRGLDTMTKDDAALVRKRALEDLKNRFVQRAEIMQNRRDALKVALQKRQQAYEKISHPSDEEHKAYEIFVEQTMWRIHVLEKRLDRHEQQSFQRYAEMDARLKSDPRLVAVHNAPRKGN